MLPREKSCEKKEQGTQQKRHGWAETGDRVKVGHWKAPVMSWGLVKQPACAPPLFVSQRWGAGPCPGADTCCAAGCVPPPTPNCGTQLGAPASSPLMLQEQGQGGD